MFLLSGNESICKYISTELVGKGLLKVFKLILIKNKIFKTVKTTTRLGLNNSKHNS